MASQEADSRLRQVVIPALENIVKNASWRKHSKLAHQCKALIEKFPSPPSPDAPVEPLSSPDSHVSIPGPLDAGGDAEYSLADAEAILGPLIAACASGFLKIADPALDCVQKLIAHGDLRGEADPSGGPDTKLLAQLVESVCKCLELGDDSMELLVLKTLLSTVTSTTLRIHGDCLLQIVRTCYDVYLESKTPVNQTTVKASLIQILVIIFRRMEADSSTGAVYPICDALVPTKAEKGDRVILPQF